MDFLLLELLTSQVQPRMAAVVIIAVIVIKVRVPLEAIDFVIGAMTGIHSERKKMARMTLKSQIGLLSRIMARGLHKTAGMYLSNIYLFT